MLVVHKYGGTSVGDLERIENVANRVIKADLLCKEKKLLCDTSHFHNNNFFLSDELALYILG